MKLKLAAKSKDGRYFHSCKPTKKQKKDGSLVCCLKEYPQYFSAKKRGNFIKVVGKLFSLAFMAKFCDDGTFGDITLFDVSGVEYSIDWGKTIYVDEFGMFLPIKTISTESDIF